MNNRHKYFRNLRHKQKLERTYEQTGTGRYGRCTNVFFLTKEPDPKDIRENTLKYVNRWYMSDLTYDEIIDKILERETKPFPGRDFFYYYDRPEVEYTILEREKPSNRKSYYKKYSNRVVRRSKDVLQHNQYRKQFDLWWTID